MSKQNSERFDFDLEASNTFTLKGEEETQIEQSSKLDIETNKKHPKASNSHNSHSSIVINNLTNYSFGYSEHILNSEENDINNEAKLDIIGTFKKNKPRISPKSRKCDSVVKIQLTKIRKSKKAQRSSKESQNSKKVDKEPNISDKAIENLIETSSINKDETSEENKMDVENDIKTDEKEKEKEFNNEEEIHDDIIEDINSANGESDMKQKEDIDVNNVNNINIQEEIKDKSSDMFIEPEKNTNLFPQEKEKIEENEVISQENNESNIIKEISEMTLENEQNKEEKENINIIENTENNEGNHEEKNKKKKINMKMAKIEENKRMAFEDVNMKEKKVENKDKNDAEEKKEEEKMHNLIEPVSEEESNQLKNAFNEPINEEKDEKEKDEENKEEKEKKEEEKEKDLNQKIEEEKKDDEEKDKDQKQEGEKETEINNENKMEEEMIRKDKEEVKDKEGSENKNIIKNELGLKKEKEEEGTKLQDNKTNNNNFEIMNNINYNFNPYLFQMMKQQIKNELFQEFIKKGNDNDFNSQENQNPEKSSTDNFLGKKRLKSPSNDLNNIKEKNENIIENNKNEIIENEIQEKEKEKDNNKEENINNQKNSSSIYDVLEKHIFNYLYDKIMKESLSNSNDLEKQLKELISEVGFSNVKSSLINIKKEKDKKLNENKNILKNDSEPNEFHYQFDNNFYHRYKSFKIIDGIQNYICCDIKCKAAAILNIKEKKFTVIKNHTVNLKEHINFSEDRPVYFMKTRKLDEVHIKKNTHNDKYHLEWFK